MNEEKKGRMIRQWSACAESRPDDAQLCVAFGGWLMQTDFSNDAEHYLKKAIELNEEKCFGANYALTLLYHNVTPDNVETIIDRLGPLQQGQARRFTESNQHHLQKYLEFAPKGHCNIHRAAMQLMFVNCSVSANGYETIPSIEKRLSGFCAK